MTTNPLLQNPSARLKRLAVESYSLVVEGIRIAGEVGQRQVARATSWDDEAVLPDVGETIISPVLSK
jgi:hypothetical protein